MIEKGIRGEICHAIHQYAKADKIRKISMNLEIFYLKALS